jgi:hypothetical protein
MDEQINDAIEGYLDHCLDNEEMSDQEISDWVHEHSDGTAWDQGMDTDELITLADEGLDNFGDTEVSARDGFRSAITSMAYYGFTNALTAGVDEWIREHDLEELTKIVRDDPREGEWYQVDDDGIHLYFDDDDDDDDYEAWKVIEVPVGKKTVIFWAEVTDEYEVTNITRMKRAVEHGREEED